MATRYIHKLVSLFYRQPSQKEDPHSFRTVNGVFGDWTTFAEEDIPPPYTQDDDYLPPPPFEAPHLRICPHETISFEDLQQVVNSLAIKPTDKTMDALMTSCHGHCSVSHPVTGNTQTICHSSPGFLIGIGTYALKDRKDTSGVVLDFLWDLGLLDGVRAQIETAADLKHYLDAEDVLLCPHKRISDSDVINAIFGFVKRRSSQDVTARCDRCATKIKVIVRPQGDHQVCYVTTRRYLGWVEKSDDPDWLAQCSV